MKPGDLVRFRLDVYLEAVGSGVGVVLEKIPYEFRGNDPFPWYVTLFPSGVLRCRERDLMPLDDQRTTG